MTWAQDFSKDTTYSGQIVKLELSSFQYGRKGKHVATSKWGICKSLQPISIHGQCADSDDPELCGAARWIDDLQRINEGKEAEFIPCVVHLRYRADPEVRTGWWLDRHTVAQCFCKTFCHISEQEKLPSAPPPLKFPERERENDLGKKTSSWDPWHLLQSVWVWY